jgi:hypothetical protein
MAGMYCEDCGILLDRHGGDCGAEAGDPYSDPDYGRPLGWAAPGSDGPHRDGELHALNEELMIPADIANLDY